MLLVSAVAAVYARGQAIERDQLSRVDAFNRAIVQQRYDDAGVIAWDAVAAYPDEQVMLFMVQKWQVVDALSNRREPPGGFVCEIVDDQRFDFEPSEIVMKSWSDLARRKRGL
jgi:hypothetical protein